MAGQNSRLRDHACAFFLNARIASLLYLPQLVPSAGEANSRPGSILPGFFCVGAAAPSGFPKVRQKTRHCAPQMLSMRIARRWRTRFTSAMTNARRLKVAFLP
jgi:hypothetical protein